MTELGKYIRDVIMLNEENHNFRIFGPDEALSNRFNHVFEVDEFHGDNEGLIMAEV